MNDRQQQFLNLYLAARHEDQIKFYDARHKEFDQAHTQAVLLAAGLMALTTIVSFLPSVVKVEAKWAWVWGVLGVFLPALSTALTAYNSLYSFEAQSKLYHDALLALRKAQASRIDAEQAPDNEAAAKLEAYVNQVEDIFRKEQGQWGQLISELKPSEDAKKNSGG
ncbi:MAG TPA: SLATT domain-containing protein [Blastocatellia bacterium]|nr:SLATT domain-containing protein [Blastocatellia bacterium]